MTNNVTLEQSVKIDRFVSGLSERTREIALAYLKIPNTPDCQPEVMALYSKYGQGFSVVTDLVESLRQEFKLPYDTLQPKLQKRLNQ